MPVRLAVRRRFCASFSWTLSKRAGSMSNASWLFVRLRSKISSTTDKKNAHFYYLSRKLKEKFPQDILFLSFDVDTLVILCKNEESKNRVQSHFHSIEEE